jgi:hypothetical protein
MKNSELFILPSLKIQGYEKSFMVFMAVMFQGEVFWVVKPRSVVVGYHCFRGPTLVSCHNTTWRHKTKSLYSSLFDGS